GHCSLHETYPRQNCHAAYLKTSFPQYREASMTIVTPKFGMGAPVRRVEDQAFLSGHGRYTDDIGQEGMLHGFVLRSPVAKGTFRIGSTEAARAAKGVRLVLTGRDLDHLRSLRSGAMLRQPD